MVIDAHAHLHKRGGSFAHEADLMRRYAERYELARIYISSVLGEGISYYPTEENIEECNSGVYTFCREDPKRYKAYAFVNPRLPSAVDTVRRGIEEYGAVGVKFEVPALCDDPSVNPVAEACIRYDVPILIHAFHKYVGQLPDETTAHHVANLAARYPELRILMAHLGGDAHHGIRPVRAHKNVWTDISGSNYRNGDIEYAVSILGADRVVFGTDALGMPYLTNYARVVEADLTDGEREKILWKNACTLFGDPLEVEK